LFETVPLKMVGKIMRCIIAIAFRLSFGIHHWESPRKPGGNRIEWNTPASSLRWLLHLVRRENICLFHVRKEVSRGENTEETRMRWYFVTRCRANAWN
jgi:hypothetical protein